LPDVIAAMGEHLSYHWTLAYTTPGGQSPQIWPRKVNTFWKPVLWFVKGEYDGDWRGDVVRSDANDKRFHEWGQSESGMMRLVEAFTAPGELILAYFSHSKNQIKRKYGR
jgi:site-specific DNA-methyltransferase (adenine-specific)